MIEPYGNLPIKDIRSSLLVAVSRFTGQTTWTEMLRWLLLKQSVRENPGRRGRPPEPSIDPKWSTDELRTRIISGGFGFSEYFRRAPQEVAAGSFAPL